MSSMQANAFVNISAGVLDVLSGKAWIYHFHCNEADLRFARPAYHFFTPSLRDEIQTYMNYRPPFNEYSQFTPSGQRREGLAGGGAGGPLTLERVMHTALWGGWQGRMIYGLSPADRSHVPSLRRTLLEAWRREVLLREADL